MRLDLCFDVLLADSSGDWPWYIRLWTLPASQSRVCVELVMRFSIHLYSMLPSQ